MNKQILIETMAERTEMSKKDTEKVLKAFEEVVTEELVSGGKVQLVGFGTFETVERKPREVGNPKNPDQPRWTTEATVAPKFKAGKALKDAVKGE